MYSKETLFIRSCIYRVCRQGLLRTRNVADASTEPEIPRYIVERDSNTEVKPFQETCQTVGILSLNAFSHTVLLC